MARGKKSKKSRKSTKSKPKKPSISIQEDKNEDEYIMIKGKTGKGRSGVTLFIREGREEGTLGVGFATWGSDEIHNFPIPSENVEIDMKAKIANVTIPVDLSYNWKKGDAKKAKEWLEDEDADDDDDDEDDEDDDDEDEDEDDD